MGGDHILKLSFSLSRFCLSLHNTSQHAPLCILYLYLHMVGQSPHNNLDHLKLILLSNPGYHIRMPWALEVLMCRKLHSSDDIPVFPACLQSGRSHPHTACQLEEGYKELLIY